jgi:aminoglycoside phosphotransferase (APT) family kinase protein
MAEAGLPFTIDAARATLTRACSLAGLSGEDAELIRLGENALFRLDRERIVVRIARNVGLLGDARKEVAVASWLRDAGLPAAQPVACDQPLVVHGHPVTFWKLIDDSGNWPTLADLARILRQLHSLPVPASLALPRFDIFGRVAERIAASPDLSDDERGFLTSRLAELRHAYADLDFPMPAAAVHGDAHQSNLIEQPDGTVLLIDFERFAFGPPESDLAVTATEHLIGWHTSEQYATFCEVYGFDVMTWPGFLVIRAINELKMTTWLMQNVRESEKVAREFRTRLASLRDDTAPREWRPF